MDDIESTSVTVTAVVEEEKPTVWPTFLLIYLWQLFENISCKKQLKIIMWFPSKGNSEFIIRRVGICSACHVSTNQLNQINQSIKSVKPCQSSHTKISSQIMFKCCWSQSCYSLFTFELLFCRTCLNNSVWPVESCLEIKWPAWLQHSHVFHTSLHSNAIMSQVLPQYHPWH